VTDKRTLGSPRLHYRRIGSTNERARELASRGVPHGTLVTASAQTAGRGRHGREWWAPAGDSLLASLVLREAPALLPLAAAVAVCDAVGDAARIKWPNDVVLEHREAPAGGGSPLAKLAGILIERRPQEDWVALGIGINVAVPPQAVPEQLRGIVATLGQPRTTIEPLLERLLRALERRLDEPDHAMLDAWRARDALRGRDIAWARGPAATADEELRERGRAQGLDGAGRLIVLRRDGRRTTLDAGEVQLLREAPGAPR
jgi:BirA family biotin operon repressor/biotin-[acetyl-CoA-carboxylase] ligase